MSLKTSTLKDDNVEFVLLFLLILLLLTFQWFKFYLHVIDVLVLTIFIFFKKKSIKKEIVYALFLLSLYIVFLILKSDVKVESFFFINYIIIFFVFLTIDIKKIELQKIAELILFLLFFFQIVFLVLKKPYDRLFFKNHSLFSFSILWLGILAIDRVKNRKHKVMLYSAMVFLMILLTSSKTGIILSGVFISVVLVKTLLKNIKFNFLIIFLILLLSLGLVLIKAKSDPFIKGRLNIWKTGVKVFFLKPLTGVGPFNFKYYSNEVKLPSIKKEFKNINLLYKDFLSGKERIKVYYLKSVNDPHNLLIQFLSELGIIGVIIILTLFASIKNSIKLSTFYDKALLTLIFVYSMLHNFNFSYTFFILLSISISLFLKEEKGFKLKKVAVLFTSIFYAILFIFPPILNPNISPYMYSRVRVSSENFKNTFIKTENYYYSVLGEINYRWLKAFNKRDYKVYLGFSEIYKKLYTLENKELFFELSLKNLKKAEALNPKSPFIKFTISNYYIEKKEYKKALFKINEALYIEPFFYNAIEMKIFLLKTLKFKKETINFYTEVLKKLKKERIKYKPIGSGRYENAVLNR